MTQAQYDRLAGAAAIMAGIGGFVYAVAFIGGVVLEGAPEAGLLVASAALVVGGLLSSVVLVAIHARVSASAPQLAALGVGLALVGAIGGTVHGGYDLANAIHAPISDVLAVNELPHPVDPRGLLTFAVAGLGLFILTWLLRRGGTVPQGLATLGMAVGALLILVYLGRLIIVTPTDPLVAGPAALAGFVLSPAFYIWLGMVLRGD
jgi:hypothetical protein